MLVAQISDTHILVPESDHPAAELRADCLRRTVADINRQNPDAVIFTGDTVQHGQPEEYARLRELLDYNDVPYELNQRLVRGLDYYGRTVFEWVTGSLGAQGTVCAGGRYDGLVEFLGGRATPAVGFALGLDRMVMILSEKQGAERKWKPELFLAYMGEAAFKKAIEVARELRHQGYICYLDFSEAKLKNQMRLANKLGAEHVLIIGEEELERERYSIKRLSDSQQWEVTLPELSRYLESRSSRQSP